MVQPKIKRAQTTTVEPVLEVSYGARFSKIPLRVKRLLAWGGEVAFLAVSALGPFHLGVMVDGRSAAEPVPLNPVLLQTQDAIARTFFLPKQTLVKTVAPLTNLLWSVALAAPICLTGVHLYGLAKTGQNWPKRWLGLRVTTPEGTPPGLQRVIRRELLGRWGAPVGIAYLLWCWSGAFPRLGILSILSLLALLMEGLSSQLQRRQRAFHDFLADTRVVDARSRIGPERHWSPTGRYSSPGYPEGGHGIRSLDRPLDNGGGGDAEYSLIWTEESGGLTSIVLAPRAMTPPGHFNSRRSRRFGLMLGGVALVGLLGLAGVLGWVLTHRQQRIHEQEWGVRNDRVFLALVEMLASTASPQAIEHRTAILALASSEDPRAIALVADILAQTSHQEVMEAVQQALVTIGPEALPALKRLNQTLLNDQAALQPAGTSGQGSQYRTIALRQYMVKRAIAKILTLYSDQLHSVDLRRTDLGQVKTGVSQYRLVLDQTHLVGIQFRGARLSGASFRKGRFFGAGEDARPGTYDDWIADLSGADLKETDFTDADLNLAVMQRSSLLRATFHRANLMQANLTGANLSGARLIGANLKQAILNDASLTGGDLTDADVSHALLQGARLGRVSAVGAVFQNANLSQSNWQNADLTDADLSGANLQSANLTGARLKYVDLSDANLQAARLRGSNLTAVNLQGANLAETDFQDAIFYPSGFVMSRDQFIQAILDSEETHQFEGVDFSQAINLDDDQLTYICAQGGLHPACRGR
ncbi:MAG: pentapeptide repeat-containing protein [Leptolyngbyaceae cyanobacterium MO_188.B28]|nr:pentapeptide repeat-containing protein [Leptolyngbyaceae cyanobacterium MO_188.B28]